MALHNDPVVTKCLSVGSNFVVCDKLNWSESLSCWQILGSNKWGWWVLHFTAQAIAILIPTIVCC